ncbi:MAG: peptidase, partial [Nodosilinea sp.]
MAASNPPPEDISLTTDDRKTVLGALVDQLDAYAFPEVAEKLQTNLEKRIEAGSYGEIIGGQQLAEILTTQLQEMSGDRNLRLH